MQGAQGRGGAQRGQGRRGARQRPQRSGRSGGRGGQSTNTAGSWGMVAEIVAWDAPQHVHTAHMICSHTLQVRQDKCQLAALTSRDITDLDWVGGWRFPEDVSVASYISVDVALPCNCEAP